MGTRPLSTKFRLQKLDKMSFVRRFLETFCVGLQYFIAFTGGLYGLAIGILYLVYFYTPLWPLVILYLSWTYVVDRHTPRKGGRDFFRDSMRRFPLFSYIQSYYPITLVKTAELDPQKNYVFGYHPHGLLSDGAVIGLGTEACGFTDKFPGIVPHVSVHSFVIQGPLYRDLLMGLGIIDVSREGLEYVVTQKGPGNSVVIIVGGAAEILDIRPNTYVLTLLQRKGFVRLALETGSPLVPVFGFGQNDLFTQLGGSYGSAYYKFQKWVREKTKCGVFCYYGLGPIPFRKPINVVVGAPIDVEKVTNPSKEQVNELHTYYVEKLKELFEKHRDTYGVPKATELILI